MSYVRPTTTASMAVVPHSSAVSSGRFAGPDGRSQRVMPLMRKVEIVHQSLQFPGDIDEVTRIVPAKAAFEDCFAAFARGTLLATDRGLVAVEDLWPGDKVKTVDAGFQTLQWRGSTILSAHARGQDPAMGKLTRISADSFGIGRPMPDLVLGPRARMVHRANGVRQLTGADAALIAARDFIDGVSIVELTPPTTVQSYHLGFERHHLLVANGVEVESMHPGPAHLLGLRGEMLDLFLSCFPHKRDLEDFGAPLLPRLALRDLDLFQVA